MLPPVLILNTHLPIFPGGGGVEALTTRHLAALSEAVGLVSMAHSARDLEQAQPLFDAGVRPYLWRSPAVDAPSAAEPARPSLRERLAPVLRDMVDRLQAGADRPADTFVPQRGFRNLSAGVWQALSERRWPIVAVVESTAAGFLGSLPRPRLAVLVMHDLRALVYERRAAVAGNARERRRWQREARRYRAFEARWCREYDLVVTVSEHDACWVREHYRPRRVITVPLPVDAGYFAAAPAGAQQPGRIVFTGLMNHPPNADAAVFFAREVLPRVRARVPGARFEVVGRHPPPEVLALAAVEGVEVTGAVPDVRPHLAQASVVVVPLRFGSGARQKILEAWCLGRCVVSTPLGAEGLEAEDGRNLLLADGAEALAEQVARALSDAELRERVRSAGRAVALSAHDPRRIAEGYACELAAALSEQGRPLRAVLDLRFLSRGGSGPLQDQARGLLRALPALLEPDERCTALLPAALRAELDWPADGRLRPSCPDAFGARLAALRGRCWQALRGALGIFRDVSPEVLRLRWLRALEADVCFAPGGPAADLAPLAHVPTGGLPEDPQACARTVLERLREAARA
jgi:glycosyltransferase involved in cell wall biosynthesis